MTNKIIQWYNINKRDLPWRKTKDGYKIWVSEIILQQTQIKKGTIYYIKFINTFPNVKSLSKSSETEILNMWQGLGYYNRALNMLHTAKYVVKYYNGIFPSKYKKLIKLKGIGEYTASAISSICSNEPKAVLDGNVYRVLSRIYNVSAVINSSAGKKKMQTIADKLLPQSNTGIYNQAMMDFGSIQCVKYNPNCNICPINNMCIAFQKNTIHIRPVIKRKNKMKSRYLNYLYISDNKNFIIQQRSEKDIWRKMYELPVIESNSTLNINKLKKHTYLQQFNITRIKKDLDMKHPLSHQILNIIFWSISVKSLNPNFQIISNKEISKYPIPKPLERYFEIKH